MFSIAKEVGPNGILIQIKGMFTQGNVSRTDETLRQALEESRTEDQLVKKIILDFSEITTIDSETLYYLNLQHQSLQQQGYSLEVHNMSEDIFFIMEAVGLTKEWGNITFKNIRKI